MKRLKDSCDVPEARHGTLPKIFTSSTKKTRLHFDFPAEGWVLPAATTTEPEEREFEVDSVASMHMVSKRDVNSAELYTMGTSRSPTTVMTANGEVQTREEATVFVKELDLFVTVMLLEETPAVLSLGKLREDHGYTYQWTRCQKPHLTKKGTDCNFPVPFVVHRLSTSSSTTPTPSSSSSSSQDSVYDVNRHTENPVPERIGRTSEELRKDPLQESTETENKNKEREEVQRDISHDLPDWLQEFRESLVDERTTTERWRNPEQGSQDTSKSSHELPMEPRAKVEPGSGKHSVFTHFLEDPNWEI